MPSCLWPPAQQSWMNGRANSRTSNNTTILTQRPGQDILSPHMYIYIYNIQYIYTYGYSSLYIHMYVQKERDYTHGAQSQDVMTPHEAPGSTMWSSMELWVSSLLQGAIQNPFKGEKFGGV